MEPYDLFGTADFEFANSSLPKNDVQQLETYFSLTTLNSRCVNTIDRFFRANLVEVPDADDWANPIDSSKIRKRALKFGEKVSIELFLNSFKLLFARLQFAQKIRSLPKEDIGGLTKIE